MINIKKEVEKIEQNIEYERKMIERLKLYDTYNLAEKFFDDILDKIKSRFEDLYVQFAFVPGNHDSDFENPVNNARLSLIQGDIPSLRDAGTMGICMSVQNNFFSFVEKYAERELVLPINRNNIFTENIINNQLKDCFKAFNIKIHCLNTAWCSRKKEEKEMKFFLPENIPDREENDIIITLMHHGKEWLNWDGATEWEDYHKKYSDIILVGHDHSFEYAQTTNYDETTDFCIRGNQLYSEENPSQSGFNIFKINMEDKLEFFYSYKWKESFYERVISSKPKEFNRSKYSETRIRLKKEVHSSLEEIEIDILSKYKRPLLLSDIYVFPIMQGNKS